MHARIIHQSSLMQVDVKTFGCLHLQGSLYACGWKNTLRQVPVNSTTQQTTNFWQFRLGIVIFLCIIISRNPPSCMITGHGKLSMFFFYNEVGQILLRRELIAESHAVIIHTKTEIHEASVRWFLQFHKKFIIAVTDMTVFSPYRFPSLIKSRCRCIIYPERIH